MLLRMHVVLGIVVCLTLSTAANAAAPVFTITAPASTPITTTTGASVTVTFSGTVTSSPAILHQAWGVQDGDTGAIIAEAIFTGSSFSTMVTLDAEPRGKPYTFIVGGVNADTFSVTTFSVEVVRTQLTVLMLLGYANEMESTYMPANVTTSGVYSLTYTIVDINPGGFDGDMRSADILWMPMSAAGVFSDYFMDPGDDRTAEQAVLDFIAGGGVCWLSMLDDAFTDNDGDQVGGWMPIDDHPISVRNDGDTGITLTAAGSASSLFTTPNSITNFNPMAFDDNFYGLDASWTELATRNDNGETAIAWLPWGTGVYLHACLDTDSNGQVTQAGPLLENGMRWLTDWIAAE